MTDLDRLLLALVTFAVSATLAAFALRAKASVPVWMMIGGVLFAGVGTAIEFPCAFAPITTAAGLLLGYGFGTWLGDRS